MRALTAIVAAVLSVTTVGPLRCPCQLSKLFRPAAAATARDDAPGCRSCPCHSHETPDSPAPAAPDPGPERPPCPHGPGVEATSPPGGIDRAGDDDPGVASADFDGRVPAPGRGMSGPGFVRADDAPPPVPDHLRYCHAFRC